MTTLEFVSKVGDVNFVNQLSPLVKKARHLIDFRDFPEHLVQLKFSLMPEYSAPDNIYQDIIGTPSWLSKFQLPENYFVFVQIYSQEDIDSLFKLKNPIDAIVFYYTDKNYEKLKEWYLRVYNSDISVRDFVNIKIKPKLISLSEDQIERIKQDFEEILSFNNYYYDEARDEVYSKGHLPIKGIRSLRKWLFRYKYSANYANCIENEKDVVYDAIEMASPISRDRLKDILSQDIAEEEYEDIGFSCAKCAECPLGGECSKYGKIIKEADEEFCKFARFNYIPISILKKREIPQKDKEELIRGKNLA